MKNKMVQKHQKLFYARIKFFSLLIAIFCGAIISWYLNLDQFVVLKLKSIYPLNYSPFIFILVYATITFIPLPFTPTSFLGATLFPVYRAFFYTLIGSMISCTLMFYFTRWFGKDFADIVLKRNKKIKQFRLALEKNAFFNIIMFRFFFIIPSEFVNVVIGMSKIRFRDYFFATLLGNIPVLFFSSGIIRGHIKGDSFAFLGSMMGLVTLLVIPLFFLPVTKRFIKTKLSFSFSK